MSTQSTHAWAVEEWQDTKLGDARWRTRLLAVGEQAARKPNGAVTKTFCNDAARQGAYGLLENSDISWQQIAYPSYAATARRCAEHEIVFLPIDGSSLTLVDKEKNKGFGRVGKDHAGARGLKVMTALAVSLSGVVLGVSAQAWWARPDKKNSKHREQRSTEEKETQFWIDVMDLARRLIREHAPTTKYWSQLDREADAWPILKQADEDEHWYTVRGRHNRRVVLADGSKGYLRSLLAAQEVRSVYTLHVPPGPHRSERDARMVVRACTAVLDFKDKKTKRHFQKTLNVVLAQEEGTAPQNEKAISWLLLTNRPIGTVEELNQVVLGYAQRWRIEDFHRTWKSGACNVEEMQLRSFEAAVKWASILAAVAARIERLKHLSRKEPERPASLEFSDEELKAIVLLRFGKAARKKVPNRSRVTIAQATRWVADIGGYTGKSSGGPPGSVTIGRGLKEVCAVARVLEAIDVEL